MKSTIISPKIFRFLPFFIVVLAAVILLGYQKNPSLLPPPKIDIKALDIHSVTIWDQEEFDEQ